MSDPKQSQKEYPEFLVSLADHLGEFLKDQGVPPVEAAKAGLEIAEKIRHVFGGEAIYLPKGLAFELTKRDAEILEKFDGTNFAEICKEYGITKRRLYQILHAVRHGRQNFLDFGPEIDDDKEKNE